MAQPDQAGRVVGRVDAPSVSPAASRAVNSAPGRAVDVATRRSWTLLALAIGLFALLLHLVAGPGHLDDVDAINFTLGVQDFDVARHQPHPPGYTLLIGTAKVVAGAAAAASGLSWMVPVPWTSVPVETAALSLIAMLAGGLFVAALQPLARAVSGDDETALVAGVLAIVCPLTLVTVNRPLSDAPGLAAALGIQALLATAFVQQRGWRGRDVSPAELGATGRLVVLAALASGLALGLRTQTAWLTLPLLVLVIADRAGRAAAAAIVGSAVTFTIGVLLWAVPLLIAVGGPAGFWQVLSAQAGEDLDGVDMLFTSPRPLWRLAMNLLQTFVLPWGPLPVGIVVLTLAIIGALVLLRHDRRGLVLLAGAAMPYAIFHLVWQENVTTRYALPLVPPIALLAALGIRGLGSGNLSRGGFAAGGVGAGGVGPRGVGPGGAGPDGLGPDGLSSGRLRWGRLGSGGLGRWLARAGAAALAVFCVGAGLPALRAYTGEPAPVFRLFADMRNGGGPLDVVVGMHRRAAGDTVRARGWVGSTGFPWRTLAAPPDHEWLEWVRHWLSGARGRTWLLADVRRTDLALVDPASRHPNGHYDWSMPYAAGVLGGTRPGALDWVVIDGPPAWFLGQGWALSPEIAGVADRDGKGPWRGGAEGWMRRSAAPRRFVIGGRNLGGPGAPPVRFTLSVGDRILDTWDVAATPGFFVRSTMVPSSAISVARPATPPGPEPGSQPGSEPGSELERFVVSSAAADGSTRLVPTAIEQFGLQPLDTVQFAFAEGWHEDELQPRTGLRWRWASGESWIQVWPVDRDVRIRLSAESPLKTFDEAPIVSLTAAGRELARVTPGEAFSIDAIVPADVLRAANGRIVLRSSRTFVPAEHVGAGDPRRGDRRALGLRVFEAAVTDASRPTPK